MVQWPSGPGLLQDHFKRCPAAPVLIPVYTPHTHTSCACDCPPQERQNGFIKGSLHIPSGIIKGADSVDSAVAQLQDAKDVVVHCYGCNSRGPTCTKILIERMAALGKDTKVTFLTGGVSAFMTAHAENPLLAELPLGKWSVDPNH